MIMKEMLLISILIEAGSGREHGFTCGDVWSTNDEDCVCGNKTIRYRMVKVVVAVFTVQ